MHILSTAGNPIYMGLLSHEREEAPPKQCMKVGSINKKSDGFGIKAGNVDKKNKQNLS